jgi:hypothetical protein
VCPDLVVHRVRSEIDLARPFDKPLRARYLREQGGIIQSLENADEVRPPDDDFSSEAIGKTNRQTKMLQRLHRYDPIIGGGDQSSG